MRRKKKEYLISIGFLTPALILLLLFIVYPVLNALHLSFHSWKGLYGQPKTFVGLQNYIKALTKS